MDCPLLPVDDTTGPPTHLLDHDTVLNSDDEVGNVGRRQQRWAASFEGSNK